jgi:hypothetical protein
LISTLPHVIPFVSGMLAVIKLLHAVSLSSYLHIGLSAATHASNEPVVIAPSPPGPASVSASPLVLLAPPEPPAAMLPPLAAGLPAAPALPPVLAPAPPEPALESAELAPLPALTEVLPPLEVWVPVFVPELESLLQAQRTHPMTIRLIE